MASPSSSSSPRITKRRAKTTRAAIVVGVRVLSSMSCVPSPALSPDIETRRELKPRFRVPPEITRASSRKSGNEARVLFVPLRAPPPSPPSKQFCAFPAAISRL